MLIDEYLLSNPIFDHVPLIFVSSDSVFFFIVPLFELYKVASVNDLRDLKREAFLKMTMNVLFLKKGCKYSIFDPPCCSFDLLVSYSRKTI